MDLSELIHAARGDRSRRVAVLRPETRFYGEDVEARGLPHV